MVLVDFDRSFKWFCVGQRCKQKQERHEKIKTNAEQNLYWHVEDVRLGIWIPLLRCFYWLFCSIRKWLNTNCKMFASCFPWCCSLFLNPSRLILFAHSNWIIRFFCCSLCKLWASLNTEKKRREKNPLEILMAAKYATEVRTEMFSAVCFSSNCA